jgi:uncharacterized RDD family membrane protein YckC
MDRSPPSGPRRPIDLGGGFVIETPEQVAFRLERAGLGSRVLATVVDGAILAVLYFMLFFIALAGGLVGPAFENERIALWFVGLLIAVFTFLTWGYYIAFEGVWNGQTPGKRAVGIRVVGDTGTPATLGQIVVRNLLRVVDAQFAYCVAVISVFATSEEKRIGDLVAGTVVVSERRAGGGPSRASRLGRARPLAARGVSPRVLELLRSWNERADDLDPESRATVAHDLANRVAEEMRKPPVPPARAEAALAELTADLFEGARESAGSSRGGTR